MANEKNPLEHNRPSVPGAPAMRVLEPLPPLTEVLPTGDARLGAFKELMHAVFEAWAQREGFRYTRAPHPLVEGFAYGTKDLGFDGEVNFVFFSESLTPRSFRTGEFNVVLVVPDPMDPTLPQQEGNLRRWGMEEIEPLLVACPALLAVYYPTHAIRLIPGYDGWPYFEWIQAARRAAATAHSPLRMVGIPTELLNQETHQMSVSLPSVFVPLRLLERDHPDREHTVGEILEEGASCVVLGDPGSGKTTLLLFLALVHAGGAELPDVRPHARLPLYLPLRELVKARAKRPGLTIADYLAERAKERDQMQRVHPCLVEAALRLGDAIVFFDGLDEVGSDAARKRVADDIRAFRSTYPQCSIWVTSRKYGYTPKTALSEEQFKHYLVAGLNAEEVNLLVERWYAARESVPGDRDRLARQLRDAISRSPSVRRLSQNPLLLTLTALIHQTNKKLPQDRGDLYEQCIQMLLKTWHEAKREEDDSHGPDSVRAPLKTHIQKDYLAHLALFLQEKDAATKDGERGLVERKEALNELAKRHRRVSLRTRPELTTEQAHEEMDDFLSYLADRTGLLIDRGGGLLSFIHLSFQEYLAAWVYTCDGPAKSEFFEERAGQPAWEEVLLLRLHIVLNSPGTGADDFDRIVSRLLRGLEKNDRPPIWLTLARALRDNLEFRAADRRAILERVLTEWLKQPTFAGEWFGVLEEITLFTDKVTVDLKAVLFERVERGSSKEVIACLHLFHRLFGLSTDMTSRVHNRQDVVKLRPDLCAFLELPAASSLATGVSVADWTTFFEGQGPWLVCQRAFASLWTNAERTEEWATWQLPVQDESEMSEPCRLGASAWFWRRVMSDLATRTAFAAKHSSHREAGTLLGGGEFLKIDGPFYQVTLPLRVFCAPKKSPGPAPGNLATLNWAGSTWANDEWIVLRGLLNRWVEVTVASALSKLPKPITPSPDLLKRFANTVVERFVRPFLGTFSRALRADFIRTFRRDYVAEFARVFRRDFVRYLLKWVPERLTSELAKEVESSIDSAEAKTFVSAFVGDLVGGVSQNEMIESDFSPSQIAKDYGIDSDAPEEKQVHQWYALLEEDTAHRILADPRFWRCALRYTVPNACMDGETGDGRGIALDNPMALPLALVDQWTLMGMLQFYYMGRDLFSQFPAGKIPEGAEVTWLDKNPIEMASAALAWEELVEQLPPQQSLRGERGVLLLAMAAYAACRAGFINGGMVWSKLLAERDTTDPRIEAAFTLYQIATLENSDTAVATWKRLVQAPPNAVRPLLEAARVINPSQVTPIPGVSPIERSGQEKAAREKPTMTLWYETFPFPWYDERTHRLVNLLATVYTNLADIRMVGLKTPVDLGLWASQGSADGGWRSLLELASKQRKMAPLLTVVLNDDNVRVVHKELRALMQGPPLAPPADSDEELRVRQKTTVVQAPRVTPPPPKEEILHTWIHLSDVHIGQGKAAGGWDQELVLDALIRDVEKQLKGGKVPAPDSVYITGDIAYGGKVDQYKKAEEWIAKILSVTQLQADKVFLVPGNHDIDREREKERAVCRLVRSLRDGAEDLDEVLKDAADRAQLLSRMDAYLTFAKQYASPFAPFWSLERTLPGDIKLILFGWNTAILAGDVDDKGKLRIGREQLAMLTAARDGQIGMVLTHHPAHDGWLADEKDVRGWLEQRAHVHLCGHVHSPGGTAQTTSGGTGNITLVAGAGHGPSGHGGGHRHAYTWGALVRTVDNKVVVRVWPRVWTPRMDFRVDQSQVSEDGATRFELTLPRVSLPPRALA